MSSPSDDPDGNARLLARLRAGDISAFDDVVRSYHAALVTYVARSLRSRDVAEDLIQELFLRLWRGREALDPAGNLTTYLYTAARNQVRDQIRRWRVSDSLSQAVGADFHLAEEQRAASMPDSEADVEAQELREAILSAVESLPERCREVWTLSRDHDLSNSEIAAVLGISVNTVKTQLGRALAILRDVARPFIAVVLLTASSRGP